MGNYNLNINEEAINFIADLSSGDVRTALNTIELAVLTTTPENDGSIFITKDVIKNCIQEKKAIYDKSDDSHYDTISAFINLCVVLILTQHFIILQE